MKYQITKATDADLALMQRLFYQTVTSYGAKIFTKAEIKIYSRLATNKEYWHKKFREDYIYNAKLNGEILGSFTMDSKGNIEYFFVHMNYHGQGIASGLFKKLEEVALEAGIEVLTTQINFATQSFFEKKGFKIVKNVINVVGGEEVVTYSGIKNL